MGNVADEIAFLATFGKAGRDNCGRTVRVRLSQFFQLVFQGTTLIFVDLLEHFVVAGQPLNVRRIIAHNISYRLHKSADQQLALVTQFFRHIGV